MQKNLVSREQDPQTRELHAACPGPVFSAGPILLRGKHLLSCCQQREQTGELAAEPGTHCPPLTSSAGQGHTGPLQRLVGGASEQTATPFPVQLAATSLEDHRQHRGEVMRDGLSLADKTRTPNILQSKSQLSNF